MRWESFRGLIKDLRTFRLEAQGLASAGRRRMPSSAAGYDALQSTFKILINSFYGYLGFGQGRFADFAARGKRDRQGPRDPSPDGGLAGRTGRACDRDRHGRDLFPSAGRRVGRYVAGRAGCGTARGDRGGVRQTLPRDVQLQGQELRAARGNTGTISIKGAALKSAGNGALPARLPGGDFFACCWRANLPKWRCALRERARRRKSAARELPIAFLAKTEALQDSLASYQNKSAPRRATALPPSNCALKSGRNFQAGDQISYYVTGAKKKSSPTRAPVSSRNGTRKRAMKMRNTTCAKLDELARRNSRASSAAPGGQQDLFA